MAEFARFLVACLVISSACAGAAADIRLPAIIADDMVLQRDQPIVLWGWADAGERVIATIGDDSQSALADTDGRWRLTLPPRPAGGPLELTLAGANRITLKNILIGDVWLCSGQSNMEWPVEKSANPDEEIRRADHPRLRLFTFPRTPAITPLEACPGQWSVCTPESVARFSATAYYFGRDLQSAVDVPIGLVHSSFGGTPAEAWMRHEALAEVPEMKPLLDQVQAEVDAWTPDQPADPRLRHFHPSSLFNGMIAPLRPMRLRGVIWYQGESNHTRAVQYRTLFPALIQSWRREFRQDDLPFLYVQIANFGKIEDKPTESTWAELREAQRMALTVPRTAMVVTIDVGEPADIHPKNKQAVGARLALAARAVAYGEKLVYSGPLYRAHQVSDDKVRVEFDHIGGGLRATGDKLQCFAIAGEDRLFRWANAAIEQDAVVVSHPDVPAPVAVRYAWAASPDACNLCNAEGLPASPFRTDDWPGLTDDQRTR